MNYTPEQKEQFAQIIFGAMTDAANTLERPKPWHPGGNSIMQVRARDAVRDLFAELQPPDSFPNPLQVMFGTGRILSSVAHDPDGQYAMLTFEDSGEDHPVGASAKHLPARQPDWRRPGQVILYFGNYASAVAVRQTLNELIDEWEQGKEAALRHSLPIPGPGGDGRTHAPFTEEQIASIVVWQKTDWVHPLTHCDGVPMMVDTNALHCTKCGAKQTWVPGRVLAGPPAKPDILERAESDASAS